MRLINWLIGLREGAKWDDAEQTQQRRAICGDSCCDEPTSCEPVIWAVTPMKGYGVGGLAAGPEILWKGRLPPAAVSTQSCSNLHCEKHRTYADAKASGGLGLPFWTVSCTSSASA